MCKFIFVTGGVVSGLGKGITAASLGRLLKARGLKVASQKLDPYINVDPGTMSPYQHGEVFVTEDGAETDLDLGHYERFIDEDLIAGAIEYTRTKKKNGWMKWAAMAACLALVISFAIPITQITQDKLPTEDIQMIVYNNAYYGVCEEKTVLKSLGNGKLLWKGER